MKYTRRAAFRCWAPTKLLIVSNVISLKAICVLMYWAWSVSTATGKIIWPQPLPIILKPDFRRTAFLVILLTHFNGQVADLIITFSRWYKAMQHPNALIAIHQVIIPMQVLYAIPAISRITLEPQIPIIRLLISQQAARNAIHSTQAGNLPVLITAVFPLPRVIPHLAVSIVIPTVTTLQLQQTVMPATRMIIVQLQIQIILHQAFPHHARNAIPPTRAGNLQVLITAVSPLHWVMLRLHVLTVIPTGITLTRLRIVMHATKRIIADLQIRATLHLDSQHPAPYVIQPIPIGNQHHTRNTTASRSRFIPAGIMARGMHVPTVTPMFRITDNLAASIAMSTIKPIWTISTVGKMVILTTVLNAYVAIRVEMQINWLL